MHCFCVCVRVLVLCQCRRVPVYLALISSAVIIGEMCGCLLLVQVRGRPQMVFGKTDIMFLELKSPDHHHMHREKKEQLMWVFALVFIGSWGAQSCLFLSFCVLCL